MFHHVTDVHTYIIAHFATLVRHFNFKKTTNGTAYSEETLIMYYIGDSRRPQCLPGKSAMVSLLHFS